MRPYLLASGRILFALPFALFGINHFENANAIASVVPDWLPRALFWVYLTGAIHVAAAVSFTLARFVRPVGIALAAMLLLFVLLIHIPSLGNPELMRTALMSALKDIALAGGALVIAGVKWER
jgi:putative oxidoreductase